MKLITLGVAAILVASSIGLAHANLVTNGDFSNATSPYNGPTEIPGSGSVNNGTGSNCTYGGQFVSGWTAGGYSIWYPSAAEAIGTNACTRWGLGSGPNGVGQRLPPGNGADASAGTVLAPPVGVGPAFIGLDGQNNINGWISQDVSVTSGQSYTVSFWWAGTQEMSTYWSHLPGPTDQWLDVSLGANVVTTSHITVPTRGFVDWMNTSITFTANSTGTEALKFLAHGNPGVPPFALLAGVSMTQNVPEPPVLAMFGGGLLGLGLFTVFARRRALRRRGTGNIA